ncbi:MAG: NADH-quinone oxidoreductase subunit M [Thermoprotei archaeon]
MVFFPIIGGTALLFAAPSRRLEEWAPKLALIVSIITAGLAGGVLAEYGLNVFSWRFGIFREFTSYSWLPQLGINLTFGVDGISIPLIVLTAVTTVSVVLSSFTQIKTRKAMYYALVLITEGGVFGVFTSIDLFVFFIFWEIVLVPMFFLIGIWGGPRREYSAYKFLLYTHVSSVIMLIGIFIAYFSTGGTTFNMTVISKTLTNPAFPEYYKTIIFGTLAFAFLVKMPVFPFHTWLPDAHVEAPSPVSVLLASLLLKMGGYGMIRLAFQMMPQTAQHYASILLIMGIVSALYASLAAYRQSDVKRMVAMSSISHMGFVLIGIATLTTIGMEGAVFQMFSHGLIIGSLFLLSGFIGESTGTRQMPSLSGLASKIPKLGGLMTFASLASVGLPGLSGFVGEYMIITGALSVDWVVGAIAAIILAITAGYYMWMLQRVIFSKPMNSTQYPDLASTEVIALGIFAVLIILLGIYPVLIQSYIEPSIRALVNLGGL